MNKGYWEKQFVVYSCIAPMLIIPLHSNNSISLYYHIQCGYVPIRFQLFLRLN